MKTKNITLEKLTGLSAQDLADVFAKNPRAYMAVKGAVAEKHLENLLFSYKQSGKIKSFKSASGDFDKDFYVTLLNNKTISLECKNVQVLNTSSKKILPQYIRFLIKRRYLEEDWLIDTFKHMSKKNELLTGSKGQINSLDQCLDLIFNKKLKKSTELLKYFPQELRESGVPRYEFSASMVQETDIFNIMINSFIKQFELNPLTIDFQRTRNSTDGDGDNRRQRLYRTDEIDIVGACLFSRTMRWQFIFGHSSQFAIHKIYKDRYANKFVIKEEKWSTNLLSSLNNILSS